MLQLAAGNLCFAGTLRAIIKAHRPFEYDANLRPLADRARTAFALPSIESHMAIVVYGYIAHRLSDGSEMAQLGTVVMTLFISFTRIAAASRFLHQVVLSWASGAIGLSVGLKFLHMLPPMHHKHHRFHLCLLLPVAGALLVYFALALEDNSCSLTAGVPNREFVRVMTEILDSAGSSSAPDDRPEHDARDAKQQQQQQRDDRPVRQNKKDSLCLLRESMRSRYTPGPRSF